MVRTKEERRNLVEQYKSSGQTHTLTFTGIKLLPFLNILLSYGKCAQPLAPKKLVDLWEENIQACADKI